MFAPERDAKRQSEYAPLLHPSHKYLSRHPPRQEVAKPIEDDPPYYYLMTTYISYLILIIFGHVRDFFGKRFKDQNYKHLQEVDGYAPLHSDFDNFYTRRLKMRINDCFARPTTGVPGRYITLLDRTSNDHNLTFKLTGSTSECLNLSSYNYLGFAQTEGPCADAVEEVIRKYSVSTSGSRADGGTLELHQEVESLVAKYVGKEAAVVSSMGFATNATVFSALASKGCLIISDELNHASIRYGTRLSGAVIRTFKHNSMDDLEKLVREGISQGQPRTHRPWKKIVVAVEGLFSMEGTFCNLPAIAKMRKKYKFYLFVDEAHSIGAVGPRGKGVCDYYGMDSSEIDILMGTFTKSFGAAGGYVAADKAIIDKLRYTNASWMYAESMSPIVLQQISVALRTISGEIGDNEGEERLQRLAFNSRYLRLGLKRLGFIVYGHDDSPIIPFMLFNPAKMPAFSREMLNRKIAIVVVGYPATPLISSRVRLCVSASHNKDDLDRLLRVFDQVGDLLQLKFSTGIAGEDLGRKPSLPPRWNVEDIIRKGAVDAKINV